MTLINLHLVLIFSCISNIWSSCRVSNSSSFCKVISTVVQKSVKGLEMGYYKMNAPKNADRCCHILRYIPSSRKSKITFRDFSPLYWLLLGSVHSSTEQKTAEMERAWLFVSLKEYVLSNVQNFKWHIPCLDSILQLNPALQILMDFSDSLLPFTPAKTILMSPSELDTVQNLRTSLPLKFWQVCV